MIHYLVDTSWLLYKGYFSAKEAWDSYPEIHFLIKKLESFLQREDALIHLCLDGYDTKGKRLLGESYKSGRHSTNNYNVYQGLSTFISLLNNKRIKTYYNNSVESDEIIFTLTKVLKERKKIISGDKDIFQALDKDVVIDNGGDQLITEDVYKTKYFDKFFGIEPRKLPLYRAIIGDASDSLKPPVARFPHKLAAKLVTDISYKGFVPSIEDLKTFSENYTSTDKKWIEKLVQVHDKFAINFDIMKLNELTDSFNEEYHHTEVDFDDFLKSKIARLNIK